MSRYRIEVRESESHRWYEVADCDPYLTAVRTAKRLCRIGFFGGETRIMLDAGGAGCIRRWRRDQATGDAVELMP